MEAKDIHMMAALHHACEGGHTGVAELLLNGRANIEASGAHRMTPLICAAATGKLPTTQFLIKRRASVRSTDEHGMNALHWAAFNGHTEIVDLLLQKRVSIRSTNEQGRTALHLAAMNKQFAVVEFLLRKQAPTDNRCRQGFTPLHYACDANNIELVGLLLASGADVEAPVEGNLRRPIHIAASIGSLELTGLLLEKGAIIDSSDSAGNRALCIACSYGHVHVAKRLLEAGALPRLKAGSRTFEDSPLCLAAKAGHLAVVALLLDSGAPPNQSDEMGWDPLLYAAHYGHPKVVEMLLRRSPLLPENFSSFNEVGFASHVPISTENKEKVRGLMNLRNLAVSGNTTPWRSPSPWSLNNAPGPVHSGDVNFRSPPQPWQDSTMPFRERPETALLPPQELPVHSDPEGLDSRVQPIASVDGLMAPGSVPPAAPAIIPSRESYLPPFPHHSLTVESLFGSSSGYLGGEQGQSHRDEQLAVERQESDREPSLRPASLPFYPFDPSSYDTRPEESGEDDPEVSDSDAESITTTYTALEIIEEEGIFELPG
jgi:ankyrin repeat protein